MRRSLTILLILFAAAAYTPLRAQSLDAFKERLAAPVASDAAFGTAKVTVTEYGDAARAVDGEVWSPQLPPYREWAARNGAEGTDGDLLVVGSLGMGLSDEERE